MEHHRFGQFEVRREELFVLHLSDVSGLLAAVYLLCKTARACEDFKLGVQPGLFLFFHSTQRAVMSTKNIILTTYNTLLYV
jgi:hypothetical protein